MSDPSLARAVAAAESMKEAAQSGEVASGQVAEWAGAIADALDGARPPFEGSGPDKSALSTLVERCDQWEDYYEYDHLTDAQTLQLAAYAHWLRVPVSWVRKHVEPKDVRLWGEYSDLRDQKQQEYLARQKSDS